MKIVLDYNPHTNDITDKNGGLICNWVIPQDCIVEANEGGTVDDIVKLKNAGFTAEEIIELKRKEVI